MSRWEGAVLCGTAAEKGGAARQHAQNPGTGFSIPGLSLLIGIKNA
ncbi:hypothetical protein M7775_15035 [Sporomusa sphaeroides DSM 2875]|nr:hypothetical protein [Sporomusa sphaeroides]MCM0759872.1 hypothetical protein [Sporomusa sphaeroides DSM 2875]